MLDLHQLGSSYFVFPSASNSRFEHSLGFGHLCQEYIEKLQLQSQDVKISKSVIRSVIIVASVITSVTGLTLTLSQILYMKC